MCDIIFENIEVVVQRCSVMKVFLEISQNSQENACARISYFEIKIPSTQKHMRFPTNFVKFLRTPFYIAHLWWLLLKTRKVFMQKQLSKGFFKKGVMRNFVEFTRKHFPESPLFIKLNHSHKKRKDPFLMTIIEFKSTCFVILILSIHLARYKLTT